MDTNKKGNKLSKKAKIILIKVFFLIAISLMIFLPGYANLSEIEAFGLVTILGIDKCEEKVNCTVEIVLPVEGGGASGENIVISGEGLTLATAFENLSIAIGRQLDFSHCALLVISKEMAKSGIKDSMEYLLSSGRVSPEMAVVVSGNESANDFMIQLAEYTEKLGISSMLRYDDIGMQNYSQTLVNFIIDINSRSQTAVMAVIKMGEEAKNINCGESDAIKKMKGESGEGSSSCGDDQSSGGSGGSGGGASGGSDGGGSGGGSSGGGSSGGGGSEGGGEKKPKIVQNTNEIAIFYKNKLVEIWKDNESCGLGWTDKKTKLGIVFINNIKVKGKNLDKIACHLIDKKFSVKAKFVDDIPLLSIKLRAFFQIEERYKLYEIIGDATTGELANDIYPAIVSEIKKHISTELLDVLKSSRKSGLDPLHINDYFYKYHKNRYEKIIASGQSLLDIVGLEIDFHIEVN